MYKENPKTKGSGIIAAIPQEGRCPQECADCFFQSGRSYLEPLEDNLPNLPPVEMISNSVVRINDGHDSSIQTEKVLEWLEKAKPEHYFFNTSVPACLERFPGPVVLTVNPGISTDKSFYAIGKYAIPTNLMMVRVRTNTWNIDLVDQVVSYYTRSEVPVILTFMAYYSPESVPKEHHRNYQWRKRTLNSYWAITTSAWRRIMNRYRDNKWVHSCGKIEGEKGDTHCRFCGNCIREYFATMERLPA